VGCNEDRVPVEVPSSPKTRHGQLGGPKPVDAKVLKLFRKGSVQVLQSDTGKNVLSKYLIRSFLNLA